MELGRPGRRRAHRSTPLDQISDTRLSVANIESTIRVAWTHLLRTSRSTPGVCLDRSRFTLEPRRRPARVAAAEFPGEKSGAAKK